jgi:alpha-galactosidase
VKKLEECSGSEIKLNFDITANRRFGYFLLKQYSTLFVENRYTDWKNYYPHKTLRNLWSLAKFIPAQKFQFEVLNQKRNDNLYGDDILKPSSYPIDYIFASVMISNPLIWMEMSGLDSEQTDQLKNIISVYKNERYNILKGDVIPIGERPDGLSHTGFNIKSDCKHGYLILLKEKSTDNSFIYSVNIEGNPEFEILATNSFGADISYFNGELTVKNMEKSGYIFLKY